MANLTQYFFGLSTTTAKQTLQVLKCATIVTFYADELCNTLQTVSLTISGNDSNSCESLNLPTTHCNAKHDLVTQYLHTIKCN